MAAEQEANSPGGDSDDEPALSSSTAAALSAFLAERRQAEQDQATADPFAENWGMSQFWYTDETAARVAEECVRAAAGGAVACLACPSLFRRLRQAHPGQACRLFEFDTRFEAPPLRSLSLLKIACKHSGGTKAAQTSRAVSRDDSHTA